MNGRSLLDEALRPGTLELVFQPIVDVEPSFPRTHAVECLVRGPKGTNLERADVLFEYVRRKHQETAMDRVCVAAALGPARELPETLTLSVNVHASTLATDKGFPGFLRRTAEEREISLERLVVEIVEYAPFWGGAPFLHALDELRRQGVKIALDDVGHGHSNYRMILDCHPDYFKIDRHFVQGVSTDPNRQAIVESVNGLAAKFGARVVAEGVEDLADLERLRRLGINLVQGYLISQGLRAADLVLWLRSPSATVVH